MIRQGEEPADNCERERNEHNCHLEPRRPSSYNRQVPDFLEVQGALFHEDVPSQRQGKCDERQSSKHERTGDRHGVQGT